jgi:hypothetical protein
MRAHLVLSEFHTCPLPVSSIDEEWPEVELALLADVPNYTLKTCGISVLPC